MRAPWMFLLALSACGLPARGQTFFPPPAPWAPLEQRSQEETDRLRAQALFIQGHIHQRRGEQAQALRLLQEAYFWDPGARLALPDIIALAGALGRTDQAVQYAEVAIERGALDDPLLKRHVADLLGQEGHLDSALRLYREWLPTAAEPSAEPNTDILTGHLELGRLLFLSAQYTDAAEMVEPIWTLVSDGSAGRENPALEALCRQLQAQPQGIHELLWEILLAARRCDAASQVLDVLDREDPDRARRAVRAARLAWCRGDRAETIERLRTYFTAPESTPDPMAQLLLMEVAASPASPSPTEERPLEEAPTDLALPVEIDPEWIERLEAWHRQAPDNNELALLLAELYSGSGRRESAMRIYRGRLEKAPDLRAYQGLVACLVEAGDITGLAQTLLEVFDRVGDPQLLGPGWLAVAQDPQQVARLLDRLRPVPAEKSEGASRAWARATLRLLLAVEMDPLPTLAPYWKPVLASPDDRGPVFLVDIGGRLVERQEYAQAVELLEALGGKTKDELQPLVYYYLAAAWAEQQRYDQAIAAARQAVSAAAEAMRPLLELRLGSILLAAGRTQEARDLLRTIVEKGSADSAEPEVREAARDARMVLASIYAQAQQPDQAETLLMEVLLEHPLDTAAANDLAYLWADQGVRLARAVGMLERVVAAEPDNAAYQDSLGWAYYRSGQFEKARDHLQLAAQGAAPDPLVLDHLAEALLAVGDRQGARATWQRALRELKRSTGNRQLEGRIRAKLAAAPGSPPNS